MNVLTILLVVGLFAFIAVEVVSIIFNSKRKREQRLRENNENKEV